MTNASSLAEPTLIGREKELSLLMTFLDSTYLGMGLTIFISGEAGSGKTRLANHFINIAKKRGMKVLSGSCLSNAVIPLFPFIEAFDSFSYENIAANSQQLKLKAWLSATDQNNQDNYQKLSSQALKDQVFVNVIKELLFLSTKDPIILFLDDLHWADSASLSLLHYIARSINSEKILLLATFRSEEIAVKRGDQPHPLLETLHLMGREGVYKEIKLGNLCQDDISKIAQSMLCSIVSNQLVEKLTKDSHGNALYVVELLRMLFENGSLVRDNFEWKIINENVSVPDKFKDIINRRLDTLNHNQRRILESASVVGDKFNPALIASITSQDFISVLEALNAIDKSSRLISCEGKQYCFTHSKIRNMIYKDIPGLLRSEYHLRIAMEMEKWNQTNNQFPFSDIAFHYERSENVEKSIINSLNAGRAALSRFANAEAVIHFLYVLENLPNTTESFKDKVYALEGMANAFFAQNKFKEAEETLEKLFQNQSGIDKLRTLTKCMLATYFTGNIAKLIVLVKEAEEYAGLDRIEQAKILHFKGATFSMQCKLAEALINSGEALRIFEDEYELSRAAWLLFVVGYLNSAVGGLEKGLAQVLRSISLYNELGDLSSQMEALNQAGTVFSHCGLYEEALKMYERVGEIERKTHMGNYYMLGKANMLSSKCYESIDPQKAASANSRALQYFQMASSELHKGILCENLCRQSLRQGDLGAARKYLNEILPQMPYIQFSFNLTLALYFAFSNEWKKAQNYFDKQFDLIKSAFPNPGMELFARRYFAWALTRQGKLDEARAQFAEIKQINQRVTERFQNANLLSNIMMRGRIKVGEKVELRLDITNVANAYAKLIRIEKISLPGFKIVGIPSNLAMNKNNIELNEKLIVPFENQSIKLDFEAIKQGVAEVSCQIVFTDNLKRLRTSLAKPKAVTIESSILMSQRIEKDKTDDFEFRTINSKQSFNFLIAAFIEDYMRRKLSVEGSGWRTFMEIANRAKVPRSCLYSRNGHRGQAIAELERRGFAEVRYFVGERGRGGKVAKARVSYEKEIVKRKVEQQIRSP